MDAAEKLLNPLLVEGLVPAPKLAAASWPPSWNLLSLPRP